MLALRELLDRHCRALDRGAAMGRAEIAAQLAVLPQWSLSDGAIERMFSFADYYETIAFVNVLAFMVHREDHHPELTVGYDRCRVRFDTHSAGGITENDFICAAKADAIFAQRYGGSGE